jgi:hypothetical protein
VRLPGEVKGEGEGEGEGSPAVSNSSQWALRHSTLDTEMADPPAPPGAGRWGDTVTTGGNDSEATRTRLGRDSDEQATRARLGRDPETA